MKKRSVVKTLMAALNAFRLLRSFSEKRTLSVLVTVNAHYCPSGGKPVMHKPLGRTPFIHSVLVQE